MARVHAPMTPSTNLLPFIGSRIDIEKFIKLKNLESAHPLSTNTKIHT
jgi:hypothetical protein